MQFHIFWFYDEVINRTLNIYLNDSRKKGKNRLRIIFIFLHFNDNSRFIFIYILLTF